MTAPLVDPEIQAVVNERGIERLIHFTTNRGLLGILAKGAILPRASLEVDDYLEKIYQANAALRRDPAWKGHTSLSISVMNVDFFGYSEFQHVEDDLWWCALAVEPIVLGHEGVVFCTGNNIWPRTTRGYGAAGLEAMFAEAVPGTYNSVIKRSTDAASSWPTCNQAEVLYPGEMPTEHVMTVYTRTALHCAAGDAMMATVDHPHLEFVVDQPLFERGYPSE